MIEEEAYARVFATALQSGNSELADLALRHLQATGDRELDLNGLSTSTTDEFRAQVQALVQTAENIRATSTSSPAHSVSSNVSKASQESFDPTDEFDQVLQSIIDRIYIYLKHRDGSWVSRVFNRRRGHNSLREGLKEFCDNKIVTKFGMSDHLRRHRMRASSSEYRRRLGK